MISKGHIKTTDSNLMTIPTLVWFLTLADDKQIFVQTYSDMPLVITVFTGTQEVVVPCRVTSPDVNVKLQLVSYIIGISDRRLAAI